MAEIKDTYRTPEIVPTKLEDDAHIDLHQGSVDLIPLKNVRLAREAMSHATSSIGEQLATSTPELEVPTPAQLQVVGNAVVDLREYKLARQLNLEDRAA